MAKALFIFIYWAAGAVISYFLPENARFTFGFILSLVAAMAYKIMTEKEVHNG